MPLACVLISDVTGSTALYERLSNAAALATIDGVLARMRALIEASGGHCVKARGDDILSFFPTARAAFDASWAMINEPWEEGLQIHAGIYFGEILNHDHDIYGDAVNTAARLSSLAKAGEILLGENCYNTLEGVQRAQCVDIGALPLRGKGLPTRVFACSVPDMGEQTVVGQLGKPSTPSVFAVLSCGAENWQLADGESLKLGRAADNDLVFDLPSVSRNHGALSIRSGQLEFTDHSSAGSLVRMDNGTEMAVHRRTTLLSGAGEILLGGASAAGQAALSFSLGALENRQPKHKVRA